MSGQYCIWQHISWQGGWGSLMSNATVPTFSHASMRTAIKNMPGMKELMHLHGLLSMTHSSTQHIAIAIHNGSVQFVVIFMRHMCWHVHIAQVVVRHFALHPQVLSWLAHYLSVRCTWQDWERGARKCWLTWSWWGNEVGTEFYDRRIQSKCVVPQTCHCYHRGPNHAWTHPAGSSARTDFHCDWPHSLAWRHSHVGSLKTSICPWSDEIMNEWWLIYQSAFAKGRSKPGHQCPWPRSIPSIHMQRSVWYPKQSSKPRKVSTPWNLASNMLEALSLEEILSDEGYCQASGACSVLCMVFSRPSWDRRSSLAAPGRCYFCMAYSSSRYPEWVDSYASWPDRSNPSKWGTQKGQQKGIASQCLLQVALKCWRG